MKIEIKKTEVVRKLQQINEMGAKISLDVFDNHVTDISPSLTIQELTQLRNEIDKFLSVKKNTEVKQKVIDVITEVLNCNEINITDDTNIFDDLGADSLDLTQIIIKLEEVFNIRIKDEEILYKVEYEKIGDICNYIKEQLNKQL